MSTSAYYNSRNNVAQLNAESLARQEKAHTKAHSQGRSGYCELCRLPLRVRVADLPLYGRYGSPSDPVRRTPPPGYDFDKNGPYIPWDPDVPRGAHGQPLYGLKPR